MKTMKFFILSAICLIFAAIYWGFILQSTSIKNDIALACIFITIALLMSGIMMEYLAVLIFVSIVLCTKIAPAEIALSGFASDAFWLIFAGLPLGLAIQKTGLANQVANKLIKICRGKYLYLASGAAIFGTLLAFIMPSSSGRVILLLPILIAFAKAHGYPPGSKGYLGLLLSGVFASNIAGFAILPANLPNIVLMGSVASMYHTNLNYNSYLFANFPVLGLVKIILLLIVICFLFQEPPSKEISPVHLSPVKLTRPELKLSIYLLILLAAWWLGSFTGLSPAWPALLVGTLCLLPRIGVLDHKKFLKEVNLELLFYIGGLMGLSAVINVTGLGNILGQKLISFFHFNPLHQFLNYYLLTICSSLIGLLATLPGIPAIMTPLTTHLAQATHLSIAGVLATQVVSYSIFILPYQSPPMLAAITFGNIPFKVIVKLCLIMTALSIIVIMPLDYLWLTLIKIF